MALSRKRKRELARLKSQASDLWDDQREVLERANTVIREASRHARNYAREEVAPRARDTFDDHVRPAVASGVSATRTAASAGREKFMDDVLPAVGSAMSSALAVLEVAKDPRVREVVKKVTTTGGKVASRAGIARPQSSRGPGRYILIGVGVVAVAAIAYAAWQTLRADDDLWIDDDELTESADGSQPS